MKPANPVRPLLDAFITVIPSDRRPFHHHRFTTASTQVLFKTPSPLRILDAGIFTVAPLRWLHHDGFFMMAS